MRATPEHGDTAWCARRRRGRVGAWSTRSSTTTREARRRRSTAWSLTLCTDGEVAVPLEKAKGGRIFARDDDKLREDSDADLVRRLSAKANAYPRARILGCGDGRQGCGCRPSQSLQGPCSVTRVAKLATPKVRVVQKAGSQHPSQVVLGTHGCVVGPRPQAPSPRGKPGRAGGVS